MFLAIAPSTQWGTVLKEVGQSGHPVSARVHTGMVPECQSDLQSDPDPLLPRASAMPTHTPLRCTTVSQLALSPHPKCALSLVRQPSPWGGYALGLEGWGVGTGQSPGQFQSASPALCREVSVCTLFVNEALVSYSPPVSPTGF